MSVSEPSGPWIRPVLISSWRDKEYLFSHLDGMIVYHRVTPNIKLTATHLGRKRHCESKCLAGGHSTMTPTRAQTQITWSGVQHDKTTLTTRTCNVCT